NKCLRGAVTPGGVAHGKGVRMRREIIHFPDMWPEEKTASRGNVVISGYGVGISVWRGRLLIEDGVGRERRRFMVHRATGGLKRLVVLGHTGSISLDALRWLKDVGAGF